MPDAISNIRKRKGRPALGGTAIGLRLLPDQLARLDAWIDEQNEPELSRPEAIRRLMDLGLAVPRPNRRKAR